METLEFKIYITFRVNSDGDKDQDPDDFVKALCDGLQRKIDHYPGGEVLELEIK